MQTVPIGICRRLLADSCRTGAACHRWVVVVWPAPATTRCESSLYKSCIKMGKFEYLCKSLIHSTITNITQYKFYCWSMHVVFSNHVPKYIVLGFLVFKIWRRESTVFLWGAIKLHGSIVIIGVDNGDLRMKFSKLIKF